MNITVESNSTAFNEHLQQVQYMVYITADSINLILGLPMNVYVLWLMAFSGRGTMVLNIFALNLTMYEILNCLSCLMFRVHNRINGPKIVSGPIWNVAIFFNGFLLTGRPLFQCCICLEHYLAVVHHVNFLMFKPLRYRLGCCSVVWVMVLGSCFVSLKGSTLIVNNLTLCLILVTCSVMLFCCLAVLRVLKRPKPGDVEGNGTNNMKLRAFRIILAIMVSMMVMYLPLALILVMFHFTETAKYLIGRSICFSITVVTGFVQPLLYLHRAGKLPCIKAL